MENGEKIYFIPDCDVPFTVNYNIDEDGDASVEGVFIGDQILPHKDIFLRLDVPTVGAPFRMMNLGAYFEEKMNADSTLCEKHGIKVRTDKDEHFSQSDFL